MARLEAYDSCALKKIGLQAALGPLVLSVQKPVLETGLLDSTRTWTKWKDQASILWPRPFTLIQCITFLICRDAAEVPRRSMVCPPMRREWTS